MLKAIAIDDEPIALDVVKELAAKISFVEVKAYFTNVFEAADYLQKNPIDLLFLDIKMPDMSGIEFLSTLPDPPMVIFTTAYSEHALKGFELDAVDYLLKPFSPARFLRACNRAYEKYQWKKEGKDQLFDETYIFLKSGYDQIRVSLKDILYLESLGNYVKFVLMDKQVSTRLTMKEAEGLLPESDFVRVHRSFIVARQHITRITRSDILLDQIAIPIGDSHRQNIKDIF